MILPLAIFIGAVAGFGFWLAAKEPASPNPYMGCFNDWIFSKDLVKSPDGRFCLWISGGFKNFTDFESSVLDHEHLGIENLPKKERKQIWDAIQATRNVRRDLLDEIIRNRITDTE